MAAAFPGSHDTPSLHTATTLVPALREGAEEGERLRRAPPRVMDALRASGLMRLLQPARYGGAQADPNEFFTVQAILASGDMSAGWVHGVMGVLAFHLALFDERAQDDVWGGRPDALLASSYMPVGRAVPVDGGFRLSGRWGFASGSDHCDWLLLGGSVSDGSGPADLRVFLVPRRDAVVHDSWDSSGLRGTGSHDVSVEDAFVPVHRTHRHEDRFHNRSPGLAVNTAPLYRIPLPQLLFRSISAPAIGALQGLLEAFVDHSTSRVAVTGHPVARDPVAQLACAEAAAEIDEMLATQARNFARLAGLAGAGADAPLQERMVMRLHATMVAERCLRLAVRLFKASGASGLSRARPFGRIFADIQAGRQHAANQYEGHGRALGAAMLGIPAQDMLL
ncbi:acyl-CoA dehydrogenase family protein [Salinarimonas soli]|uniref:Flavin-dependent monooxygenase n=1 Tax=Salinarimonas soli TaxID=1638099 RepID=A0A5B2VZK8_9HYPH|nr:acyl-CoA dehydrogenase family protein [Salinarimonas soli]KAA2244264.1 flavin-dependent monooxygenase [Salinarimonas soli]